MTHAACLPQEDCACGLHCTRLEHRAVKPAPCVPQPAIADRHGCVLQVWIQPFYGFVDLQVFKRFPNSKFLQYDLFAVHVSFPTNPLLKPLLKTLHPFLDWELPEACEATLLRSPKKAADKGILLQIPGVGLVRANPFRLIWRTIFVILVTLVACLLPFFNDIVALLGASHLLPACSSVCGDKQLHPPGSHPAHVHSRGSCSAHLNSSAWRLAGSIGFGPLTVFFPVRGLASPVEFTSFLRHIVP